MFELDKQDLRIVQDLNEQEMLKTNRLVKNEVLEMAEMVERLTVAV
jgi:hypothetical protein